MQIFLPFPDFEQSCNALDTFRLGKQRIEAFQIWKAVTSQSKKGWANHVVTRMWKDYLVALRKYLVICCRVYGSRKTKKGKFCQNTKMLEHIKENNLEVQEHETVVMPPWIGDAQFHDSHKAMLYHKGVQNVATGLFEENPYTEFKPYSHISEYHWPIPLLGFASKITASNPASKKRKSVTGVTVSSKKVKTQ